MCLNKYARFVSCLAVSGLLLAGLFLILSGTPQVARANPGNYFVTYSGAGDCSQASPCNLQTALGVAGNGDAIYIEVGTYTGSGGAVITVTHSIAIYGGWDGSLTTPPVRKPKTLPSTIDGGLQRRGVFVGSGLTVTLDGLTITRGKYVGTEYRGAGLYARYANLTLRQMTFYRNAIDVFAVSSSDAYGGGAMVSGGTLVVDSSTFQENSAWASNSSNGGGMVISYTTAATVTNSLFQDNDSWWGGGLYFWGQSGPLAPFTLRDSIFTGNGRGNSPGAAYGGQAGAIYISTAKAKLEGNTIRDNKAFSDYGALRVSSCDVLLRGNIISGNECDHTSGLYLYYASPFTVTNNIIAGNLSTTSSKNYPAVRVFGGSGKFLHNTIAGNHGGYGILVDSGGVATLTNTIIVSHTLGISVTAGSTSRLGATLWGSGVWANGKDWGGPGTILTGTLNIWGNPAFVNPAGYNYHIGSGSAALDSGVNAGVTNDIDGEPRPVGAGFDIGADELDYPVYLPVVRKN